MVPRSAAKPPEEDRLAHAEGQKAAGGWSVVSSGTLPRGSVLKGVAASDARHAWAVGSRETAGGSRRGVIQAWNGRAWRTVAGAPPAAEYTSVSARTARDVWAVGRTGNYDPVVAHYDGHRWSRWPVRGLPGGQQVSGVATAGGRTWVISGTDVYVRTKRGWSGTRLADPDHGGALQAVRARGPNDVWAVGVDHREGEPGDPYQPRARRDHRPPHSVNTGRAVTVGDRAPTRPGRSPAAGRPRA